MNKIISCFLAVVMIFANTSFIYSAEKKDVSDPILREMISELSNTMPRFINKYGANVFVSDEQITRAALIQALYEYNKNNKSSSAAITPSSNIGFVSKDDFNLLKNKVTALEKKSASGSGSASISSNLDMIKLMNDLEPNMPMLLDNSLQNSKVFKDLQKKVDSKVATAGGGSVGAGISSSQLESIKTDITNLTQKYDALSASLTSSKDSKMSSSQVSANISVLQKEVANINAKLASLQDTVKSSSVQGQNKNADLDSLKQEIASLKTRITNIDTTMLVSSKGDKATNVSSQEIKNLSVEVETLKKSVIQAQKSYVDVAKRVNSLEDRPVVNSSGSSASSSQIGYLESKINSIKKTVDSIPTNEDVKNQISKSNSKTSTDIKKIENRLNELEKNKSSYKGSSGTDSSSGSSAGTITKISLGLTLVAALFIAR